MHLDTLVIPQHPRGTPTPNKYRFSRETYHVPNVGHIDVDWQDHDAIITVKIMGIDGPAKIEHTVKLSELQA